MYEIITDTSANLDVALLRQQGIGVIPFSFYIDGQETRCTDTEQFDAKAFYDGMRRGTPVTTSQLTPQRYLDCFAPLLAAGRDILFVGMSSGVSGSYASARMAAAQLQEEFPQRKLRLVDTLSASLGEGLQVLKAAEYRAAGIDLDTAADRLLEERHRMCQVFTVEDLRYLRRSDQQPEGRRGDGAADQADAEGRPTGADRLLCPGAGPKKIDRGTGGAVRPVYRGCRKRNRRHRSRRLPAGGRRTGPAAAAESSARKDPDGLLRTDDRLPCRPRGAGALFLRQGLLPAGAEITSPTGRLLYSFMPNNLSAISNAHSCLRPARRL